jgi:hypothetical protein
MEGGKPILEIAPKALDGIEFGGVRRKEQEPEIGGEP